MACPGGICSRKQGSSVGAKNMPVNSPALPSVGARAQQPPTAGFFSGTNNTIGSAPRLTQEQLPAFMEALKQLLSQLQGLPQQNAQFSFEPIQQDITRQFYNETVPTLAERFTAMGHGAQNSSAFQGALGAAGAGLGSTLASLRSQYGLQQQGNLNNQLNMLLNAGLGSQRENFYSKAQPSGISELGGKALELAPKLLTAYFGGL